MNELIIYRGSSVIATVSIDEKTKYSKKLMTSNSVSAEFYSENSLGLQIGDHITINSQNYYINKIPTDQRINDKTILYNITFESVESNLSKKKFRSIDGLVDFSLNGTALSFATKIIENINEIDPGWTMGDIDDSDYKTITFSSASCKGALSQVSEKFVMEYDFVGKVLNLKKSIGVVTDLVFKYGQGNGLYNLKREQVQDQNIVTRMYGFGGTTNIQSDYRDGTKQLVFEELYLEKNVDLYGIIEGDFTDEDIFPQRTGYLTDVNILFNTDESFNNQTSWVEDTTIDFDINDYLIEGQTALIIFKTGDLGGVEPGFEIWKYDNTNHRIYFNSVSGENGYTVPKFNDGSPIIPLTGDSYTLTGISMPQSYIDDNELILKTKTQASLDENSVPQVVYTADIDPKFVKNNSVSVNCGDRVTVIDEGLGIDSLIRISGIEWPLVNPNKIELTIADKVGYTYTEQVIKAIISNQQEIVNTNKSVEELAWLASMKANQQKKVKTVPMYQGIYSASKTYFGNLSRIDIVKYNISDDDPDLGYLYYIARIDAPAEYFSGISPTNTRYWKKFDAQYNSIATEVLLAEYATIQNLRVDKFDGISSGAGNLSGTVTNVQPNVVASGRVDKITIHTTTGSTTVECNGYSHTMTWNATTSATIDSFIAANSAGYGNVTLTKISGSEFTFSANNIAVDFAGTTSIGSSFGTVSLVNPKTVAVAQVDKITLSGDSGQALIAGVISDGILYNYAGLGATASDFVSMFASDYLTHSVILTSSGIELIFTSSVAGTAFTHPTITNYPLVYRGAVSIFQNDIWENSEDGDTGGIICINRIGYEGGVSKFRTLIVFDGKGKSMMRISGSDNTILMDATLRHSSLPTSPSGLAFGTIYRDGTSPNSALKIV